MLNTSLTRSRIRFSGVMNPDIKDLTADGYDLQFGTNVLGKSTTHDPQASPD